MPSKSYELPILRLDGIYNPTFIKDDLSTSKDFSEVKLEDGVHKKDKEIVAPPKDEEDDEEERQQWSHPIEFFLSCIAMSVGLGNVWRFPTTAYNNGGGAFLIPYLIVLTFIGRPLYFMELAMGQFSSYGCVKMWKCVPAAKGVGYGQMIATWSVVTYYCVLMTLTVFYFMQSFQDPLPWTWCDPSWANNLTCVDATSAQNVSEVSKQTSSEQYFYQYVTRQKDSIDDGIGSPDIRLTACLLFSWITIFFTLVKGVKSSGKVAYFTALFPYVVLITLLVRGVTLPGALKGIMFYITPQWEKLLDPNVWYAAVTQSFFSLSVGFGSIPMFASYNSFRQSIYRDAWLISLADTLTSFLAGFTIFSILGNLAYEMNIEDIKEVALPGTGLAFISYPNAIAKFQVLPQLFSVLFFLMLYTLGLGSAVALTNCVITVICDQRPRWSKLYVTLFICILGFLIGLVYVTPVRMNRFIKDIKFMLNVTCGIYWKFCWSFLIPCGLTGILIYSLYDFNLPTYAGKPLPQTAYICGWLLAAFTLCMVPVALLHSWSNANGSSMMQKFQNILVPKDTWGPKKAKDRREWEKFTNSDVASS